MVISIIIKFVGVSFITIGIGLFLAHRDESNKILSLKSARYTNTNELKQISNAIALEIGEGDWRDYIKIWGKITCKKPLVSQLKQESCVYYEMSVTQEYQETIQKKYKGKLIDSLETKSQVIATQKRSIAFKLKDKWGKVTVNPQEADIDSIEVVNEFHPDNSLGDNISFGDFSLVVKNQSKDNPRKTIGFHYKESILPIGENVLVLGTASDETTKLIISNPINTKRKFIISRKTNDALMAQVKEKAKVNLISMVIFSLIGILLLFLPV